MLITAAARLSVMIGLISCRVFPCSNAKWTKFIVKLEVMVRIERHKSLQTLYWVLGLFVKLFEGVGNPDQFSCHVAGYSYWGCLFPTGLNVGRQDG